MIMRKNTDYYNSNPSCIDCVNLILEEEGLCSDIIGLDVKRKMLNEAINDVWNKNELPEMYGLQKRLVDVRIRNLGESGAKEVLGKLGILIYSVKGR